MVVGLRGGPWDGQEVFVPTLPRPPYELDFPVQWHDGSWDNAHWHWVYLLRGTPETGWYYECVGCPSVPGLTNHERQEQEPRKRELLVRTEP
jgi:hypothetical protein